MDVGTGDEDIAATVNRAACSVDSQSGIEHPKPDEVPMLTRAPRRHRFSTTRTRGGRKLPLLGALCAAAILAFATCILAAGFEGTGLAQTSPAARLVEIKVLGSERYSDAEIIRVTELKLGTQVTPQAFQEAANRLAGTGAFSDVNYGYSSQPGGVAVEFRLTDGSDFGACNFDNLVWFSEKELRAQLKQMIPLFGEEIPLTGDIPAKIEAALTYLLKEKGIPGTVTIMGAGEMGGALRAVQFNVTGVRLTVQQLEFSGAQAVEPTALIAAIQPLLGTDYDQGFVREFIPRNVGPLFWRLGYLKVAFGVPGVELLTGSSQDLSVTIPVTEGDRYSLQEILWSGNEVIPPPDLTSHIHVMPGQPADVIQVEKDLEEIKDLYAAKGYLTAHTSFRPAFDDLSKSVSFDVQVYEGDLYSMGKLEIDGIDPARAEALKESCELAPGQPYNRSYWSTFISKSGRLLPASRTWWKTSIKENINAESKTVDITLTFLPNTGE